MLPAIVLASASPARLQLLRNVGIEPAVVVSDIDETAMVAAHNWQSAEEIAGGLAVAKAEHVGTRLLEPEVVVIGCDSMMEFQGHLHGKPGDAAAARHRLAEMSGGSGFLHTGHHVIYNSANGRRTASAVTSTEVVFHELTEAEIDAYVATGEPLHVAGAYTLDSLGGPFIKEIHGDPSNVIGLSLPTLRHLFAEVGIAWDLVLRTVAARQAG